MGDRSASNDATASTRTGGQSASVRLLLKYLACLASVAIPALIAVLVRDRPGLGPLIRFFFVLDVAAAAWFAGFWAGILVTAAAFPVVMFVYSGGHAFVPTFFEPAAVAVMVLVAGLASRVAASQKRVQAVLRSANQELDLRVQERTRDLERARESLQTTLASIGDAVIATDTSGKIVLMNGVAESLTGWKADEALGRPLEQVFVIVNAHTRHPVENPRLKGAAPGSIRRTGEPYGFDQPKRSGDSD